MCVDCMYCVYLFVFFCPRFYEEAGPPPCSAERSYVFDLLVVEIYLYVYVYMDICPTRSTNQPIHTLSHTYLAILLYDHS